MSDSKMYDVPADFASRALTDDAGYEAMYQRSIDDPDGFWAEQAEDSFAGYGQRVLVTDADEYPLLNVRRITFDVEQESAEEGHAGSGSDADSPDG